MPAAAVAAAAVAPRTRKSLRSTSMLAHPPIEDGIRAAATRTRRKPEDYRDRTWVTSPTPPETERGRASPRLDISLVPTCGRTWGRPEPHAHEPRPSGLRSEMGIPSSSDLSNDIVMAEHGREIKRQSHGESCKAVPA